MYIVGSIPFGLLYIRFFYKKDLRKIGSGNIGATNVYRTAGLFAALVVFFCDFFKTVIPILLAKYYLHLEDVYLLHILFASVLGHIFPIFLKFKGGKGVASIISGCLIIQPMITLCACVIWLGIFLFFRYSSLASISSVLTILFGSVIFLDNKLDIGLILSMSIVIIYRHKSNIFNLIEGKERKIK
ncbi:glycerol-3-phosphate 1-O-acyltransferase PlsY [Anaplasmataceae bacterium AB001_6]|nr:glycerol-3-phosphate 1-O-acyltransferase PlsY [Anaplasmataceae bacterium AB001_6]